MNITPNYDLQPHNTLALPSTAAYYIQVESPEDAELLSRDEFFRTLPYLPIGGGSNLLFRGDFKGAILHYEGTKVTTLSQDAEHIIQLVEAGKNWHQYVMESAEAGLWGIENLALIPGEVGAAAVQNIGAYGREICQAVVAVHIVDLRNGQQLRLLQNQCHYAYRHSIFKEPGMEHALVIAVELQLSKIAAPQLSYAGLSHLQAAATQGTLTPLQVANEVIQIREKKLPDPAHLPNAGSFFMNPILTQAQFHTLQAAYPQVPFYKTDEQYKIPAAWLIEQAGFKGKRQGAVGTYQHQPLVIVNHGGAQPHQVVDFAAQIQNAVQQQFHIHLTPEVRYINSNEILNINQLEEES